MGVVGKETTRKEGHIMEQATQATTAKDATARLSKGAANNYYVIGGQYEPYCYGGTPTLIGAKRLAGRNMEYWDNHQGWHRPRIYESGDVIETEAHGCVTHEDGDTIIIPRDDATPVA